VTRIAPSTPRVGRVTAWTCLGLAAATLGASVRAEEGSADPAADLRLAARASAPVEERLAAARRLAAGGVVPDGDRAVFAAASLLPADPATAGALARAALDAGEPRAEARDALLAAARADGVAGLAPSARRDVAAVRLLLGDRAAAAEVIEPWPPSAFGLEVLRRDAPEADVRADAALSRASWADHAGLADLLDRAAADDTAVAWPAMDALRARGEAALPLLLATAAGGPATPRGLRPRRVRAIVVLGTCGDRRATPVLCAALSDREDGWVRAAAAAALGDLGDPAAAVPLARTLHYLGDVHRPRDSWDYPGKGNTDVPAEAWGEIDYYAVDVAVCAALLRLGVAGAAEWLLRERLDPRTGRWRVRVLQDAADALRLAFPDAPAGYEPDAGYPQRLAACEALRAWWRGGPRLARPLDETDPGFSAASRALAASIGGKGVSVMDTQIAKGAAALLGPPAVPALLATASASKSRVQRAEIATVLGTVRDRRCVAPLLALSSDPVPAVRANAAEALAAYVDPPHPALLENAHEVATDAVVARWIALLDDPDAGPRASALKALSSLPPRADVRDAVAAHAAAVHPENAFGDWTLAEGVVRLVQTGEGLDEVLAVLGEPDLFRRRFVWELLRPALRLDPWSYDPAADPGAPRSRRLDPAVVRAALDRRRGA
jgi:HEAT repeat protein